MASGQPKRGETSVRKHLLVAVAVAAVAGLGGYSLANYAGAQGVPAAQGVSAAGMRDGAPMHAAANGWAAGGWRHARDGRWDHRQWMVGAQHRPWHMAKARSWGLFYPQSDKKLSVADVTTLAQGILLRHGNHTWKVIDAVQNQDNTVSFAFATQNGGVIARFAMDTQTGRLRRIG